MIQNFLRMMWYILYDMYHILYNTDNHVYKNVFVEFIGQHQLGQIETFNLENYSNIITK